MSEQLPKDYLDEFELPEKIKREIEEVAKELKLSKEQKAILEEEVKKEYRKGCFEPGEAIGIITAQSISEPATQMTMRAYHVAGAATIRVTQGLPRLIEIFDARKEPKTPMMVIYLKKEFNNVKVARKIAEEIRERKVVNLIKGISLDLNKGFIEIEPSSSKYVRVLERGLRENLKDVNVRVGEKIKIVPKKRIDIKELERLREKILETSISGIKGIINAIVRREGSEWIINTLGSNLEEVLKIKEVDETRTISNNVFEVLKIFGIEAVRNLIINEASKTLSEQGLDVDIRHLTLVADIMTFSGTVRPIGRYGVAGSKPSVLARAAFEETIRHLARASLRNEVDELRGIFENVMIGQVVPVGTGMFELIAQFKKKE